MHYLFVILEEPVMVFQAKFMSKEAKTCCRTMSYPNAEGTSAVTDVLKTFRKEANEFLTKCIDNSECIAVEGIVIHITLYLINYDKDTFLFR